MVTKNIAWDNGIGSITAVYDGSGDGVVQISSDPNNLYEARSKQIKVKTADGSNIERIVTVTQAAKVRINISTAVVTASNQTYNGSAKTPTPTVTLNGTTVPSSGYDVAYSNNVNAGTATITITGKGDYEGTTTGTFTIVQATGQVTTTPTAISVTYSGSTQYLVTAGSGTGTMLYRYKLSTSSTWSSWSTTRPRPTNAGTYNVQYKAAASSDGNYTESAVGELNVTMAKANRTISFITAPTWVGTNNTVTVAASPSAGSGDGTITYTSGNTSRATISGSTITGKSAGSVTITATISAGTNYNSASTSYTIIVINSAKYVDLGLSSGRMWAVGNITLSGSTYAIGSNTDYGCYFSYGNIDGHNDGDGYNWGNLNTDSYASTQGAELNLSKDQSYGSTSKYDAAYNRIGPPWRVPRHDDIEELINETDHEWTAIDGVNGLKFMKKNDHSVYIFLPASGVFANTSLGGKNAGCYYPSSTISSNPSNSQTSYQLYGDSSELAIYTLRRCRGATIRPVLDL